MIPFNPKTISISKREQLFREHLGGACKNRFFNFTVRTGVTGLEFHDFVEGEIYTYQVAVEAYERGLLLFCRYFTHQKWILIPFSELESITITKKPDLVKQIPGSWFRFLEKMGVGYRRARNFILEKEWVKQEKMEIILSNIHDTQLVLTATEKNHPRILHFFSTIPSQHKLNVDVSNYEYV